MSSPYTLLASGTYTGEQTTSAFTLPTGAAVVAINLVMNTSDITTVGLVGHLTVSTLVNDSSTPPGESGVVWQSGPQSVDYDGNPIAGAVGPQVLPNTAGFQASCAFTDLSGNNVAVYYGISATAWDANNNLL